MQQELHPPITERVKSMVTLTRRQVLKVLIAGSLAAFAGFLGIQISSEKPKTRGEKFQGFIEEVESYFGDFTKMVRPKIQEHVPGKEFQMRCIAPFDCFEANRNFPHRNALYVQEQIEGGRKEYREDMNIGNFFFHSLQASPEIQNAIGSNDKFYVGAAYATEGNTIFLNEAFDPSSPADLLTLYHELVHKLQQFLEKTDSSEISKRRLQKKKEMTETAPIVLYEANAYRYQLEVLNAALDNELFETRHEGTAVSSMWLSQRLEADDKDPRLEVYTPLALLSNAYFPSRRLESLYIATRKMYLDNGLSVYEENSRTGDFELRRP